MASEVGNGEGPPKPSEGGFFGFGGWEERRKLKHNASPSFGFGDYTKREDLPGF
jgi:hypothetical protein